MIEKLTEHFMRFPGIGPRQASRFSHFILRQGASWRRDLAHAIERAGDMVAECAECRRVFEKRGEESVSCTTCGDSSRDARILMVVEKDLDLDNIERCGGYRGKYFVLGGTLPILEKEPEKKIRIAALKDRLMRGPAVEEVVLALSLTTDGEHTREYVHRSLAPLASERAFRISTLGRGLSTGIELEYSDAETLKNALERRIAI